MSLYYERDSAIGQEYIGGKTTGELGEKYGLSVSGVCAVLRRQGVPRRNGRDARRNLCSIDHTFFASIDSHVKAQILGFIYADGCVSQRTKSGSVLQIGLKSDDGPYLEELNTIMKNERKVKYAVYHGRDGVTRSIVRFATTSPQIIADLARYNVGPRKSLVIGFPTSEMIPDEFLPSFIRGVFEGDGCIYVPKPGKRKHRCASVSIAATINFNECLRTIMENRWGIHSRLVYPKRMRGKNFCVLEINTVPSVRQFYRIMYADVPFVMDRKRRLFEEFLANYAENGEYRYDLRSSSVAGVVRCPDGVMYAFNTGTDFAREKGLNPFAFLAFVGRRGHYAKSVTYKGWTLPTEPEIAAARANGTLIEKLYRAAPLQEVAPLAPVIPITDQPAVISAA